MGKSRAGAFKGAGKKGKLWKGAGPTAKKDWHKKVPWSDRLSKYFLRPYVDQVGSPFAGAADEKDLLSTWHLQGVLGQTCSEYCARQGVALSEGAANLEVGAALLGHHFSTDAEAALQKLSIRDLLKEFDSADGKKFLQACKYLNTSNTDIERSEEATSAAVKRFLRFFTTDAGKKEVYFKKLARFSARLYLFAFEGLEAITALNNPKVMAAGVHHIGADYNLPGPSKTWLKKPADQEAMLWSFAAAFHQQKLEDVKKRSGASAFDDWEETAPDPWDAGQKGGYGDAWGLEDEDDEEVERPRQGAGKRRKATEQGTAVNALASDEEAAPARHLDLESSSEDAPDPKLDLQGYSRENLSQFKSLMEDIGAKEPKDRPAISDLHGALKLVPTSALAAVGLQSTVEVFMKKTRYPKAENLQKFLEALRKLASTLDEALPTELATDK